MRPQPRTEIVELFGLAGAGKSTLADAARRGDLLTRQRLSAQWQTWSLAQRGGEVLRAFVHFESLRCAFRLATRVPLANRDSLFRLIRLVAKAHWLKSQGGRLLLDQGLHQEVWSILFSAGSEDPDPAIISPLIQCLYRGTDTKIVFIDVDSETASARISGRRHGQSRFDTVPEDSLRQQLERSGRLTRRIVDASRAAGLRVERLDGSATPASLVKQLKLLLPESR